MSSTVVLTQQVTLSTYMPSLQPQRGDIIMVQHPPRPPQGNILYELFVVDTYWLTSSEHLYLVTLPSENWTQFEKLAISDNPASRTTLGTPGMTRVPHNRTVDAGATITLRPSNQIIRDSIFGGDCPYEMCQFGIAVVNETSIEDLSLGESSRGVDLTLCPFCMGVDILRDHEDLVRRVADASTTESATEELLRDASIRSHRRSVNDRRLELGYMDLPDDPGLYGLGSQTGTGDDAAPTASAVEYMWSVSRGQMSPPTSPAPETAADLDRTPTGTVRREGNQAPAIRGRSGRGSRGNVMFRRLDLDRRPGSNSTYEVPLGHEAQLAEATLRIRDYHATLGIGNGATATTALEITVPGDAALQDAVRRAFEGTNPVVRPGTPFPPPAIPDQTRGAYRSAICTEPFRWYKLVQERVLDDICAICHERFDNGLSPITALPCSHFFHEECIRGRTRERTTVTCPYRCAGYVQV